MEGKDKREIEKRILLTIKLQSSLVTVFCICWFSVDIFHTEPVQSGGRPSGWPFYWLICTERWPAMQRNLGSCSLRPVLQLQMCFCQDEEEGFKEHRAEVEQLELFLSRLAPKRPSFFLHLESLHHSPSSLVSLDCWPEERTPDRWMKARNPFSIEWWCCCMLRKKKKSKGKLMSLTCIKHLNMCSKIKLNCIVGNVGTTFKKKRLNKADYLWLHCSWCRGLSLKERFILLLLL